MGTKLLITNLPLDFDPGSLEDMFMSVGDVRAVQVELNEQGGRNSSIGRIEMSTEEAAKDAIVHFHGQVKNGNRIIVQEDKPHVDKTAFQTTARRPLIKNGKLVLNAKKKARSK